jgi:hypothetical protein
MEKEQVDLARSWCEDCKVSRDCLIFSMQQGDRFGIWGGFTPEERRRMREEPSPSGGLLFPSLYEVLAHFDQGTLFELVVRL